MGHTMADLPDQIPTPGVIALLLAALGATPLWRYLKQRHATSAANERERDKAQRQLTAEEREAQRAEQRDLVVTLKARLDTLEAEVKTLRDERVADKSLIASLTAKLDHSERDKLRLRKSRDHYRQLAFAGQRAAELAGDRSHAEELLEEISEADEASSLTSRP